MNDVHAPPVLADSPGSGDRSAVVFLAWTTAALPRAFPGRLALSELHAAWTLASRDIAARLALACVRESLVDSSWTDRLQLHTPGGPIGLEIVRRGAYDLHRPDLDAPRAAALEHPGLLLRALGPGLGLTSATAARIEYELADSVFHLAVARAVAELRVRARLGGLRWPAPIDPENLVITGHPWHPMCKTRLGLHLHEVLRLAPEGLAAAEIHAVDVRAGLARSSGVFSDMSEELFPPAPPGWLRLPAHGLQRRRLPRLLNTLWGRDVRPTDVPPVPARALLSLRTVATAALHVKLSADLQTTSARRQVSPMSSANGPQVGALLDAIAATDVITRRGLRLQHEPASAGLDPHALGERSGLAGSLGVIFRRDLRAPTHALAEEAGDADPGEPVAWVCAALGERWPGDMSVATGARAHFDLSPGTASTNIATLLHRREGEVLLRTITAAYPSPLLALRRYVDLLVPPALRLCTAHGVALEVHLQNTLVVHRRGRLCGFIVRDLGGIRMHRGRLAAAGHAPELAAGSFIVTDDLAETQTKLAHTLLHAHLAAVFAWAVDLLGLDEAALWAHTRAVIAGSLAGWAAAQPQLATA